MHGHFDLPHARGKLARHSAAGRYDGDVVPAARKLVGKVYHMALDAAYLKLRKNFDYLHLPGPFNFAAII